MKKTLVVPIDFTSVSHEALLYACELSVKQEVEILAVHVIDTKTISDFSNNEIEEVREAAKAMYDELVLKTKADIDNFLEGLSVFYGDILRPFVTTGTIYEAFNKVAETHNSPLIIMGTHGIVGMQHIFGSKAYKVLVNTPIPFLVVQERSYNPIKKVLVALENEKQINSYIDEILVFASLSECEFIFNVYNSQGNAEITVPDELEKIKSRCKIINKIMDETNTLVELAKSEDADVIGIIISETDNQKKEIFGLEQDKILVNNYKKPVWCLPIKTKK